MRIIITITLAAALAGCTPRIIQGSSAGGTIGLTGVLKEQSKAAAVANGECAKYGKVARITRMDILSDTASYECAPQ